MAKTAKKENGKKRLLRLVREMLKINPDKKAERLSADRYQFDFGGVLVDIQIGYFFCRMRIGEEEYRYGPFVNLELLDRLYFSGEERERYQKLLLSNNFPNTWFPL
jgi:hypothetical protein